MGRARNKAATDDILGNYVEKEHSTDRVISLAGNPNVGKSTVFNALTGLKQHTGNWPGKTVSNAAGVHKYHGTDYIMVDLPGTYSIMPHSTEEQIARDFILFGNTDAVIAVCDATCLERNLNLVLQTIELTPRVVVCINLMDEADKKGIQIDLPGLSHMLGVPVVGVTARDGKGINQLMDAVERVCREDIQPIAIDYNHGIIEAVQPLALLLEEKMGGSLNSKWLALRLIAGDETIVHSIKSEQDIDLLDEGVVQAIHDALSTLEKNGLQPNGIEDAIVADIVHMAERISRGVTTAAYGGCSGCCSEVAEDAVADSRDRKLDRMLTSKRTGIPVMLGLLCVVLWLTITGSNYPSQLLSDLLFWVQDRLTDLFQWLGAPDWLHGIVVLGAYRVLAWVVSVMLPPMAIFFPLFTLLEDFGYLPRIAFNLDHIFKKARTCGKQALTMCMGFGCNAAGVIGCRIIDSPRERLIAIITNSFVPCNGRFPTLIAIISMFFTGIATGILDSLLSALILTGVIVLGVLLTFAVSRFLSSTVLKGEPSSFALELPPYRTPKIGKVIVRSIFDRTLFVLGRAVAVAAPAGLLIWLMANVNIDGASLLHHFAVLLDPFAHALGMDGVILIAFILGFPANEIVVPIIIMAYMSTGTIMELDSLAELKTLLLANGWTWATAVSTMLFCLVHWPCSTTCLTIRKEAGTKWMLLSIALPTVIGMFVCFIFTTCVRMLGLV